MQFSNDPNRMSAEFRQRAEELDISTFQALSPGIGLGRTRSVSPKIQKRPEFNMAGNQAMFTNQPAVQTRQHDLVGVNTHKNKGIAVKLIKFAFAHGIDLFIIGATVCLALIAAGAVFYFKNNGLSTDHRVWLAPLKVFSRFGLLELLAITYAIFVTYWLVFKFAVGKTLGESFFGPKRGSQKVGRQKRTI